MEKSSGQKQIDKWPSLVVIHVPVVHGRWVPSSLMCFCRVAIGTLSFNLVDGFTLDQDLICSLGTPSRCLQRFKRERMRAQPGAFASEHDTMITMSPLLLLPYGKRCRAWDIYHKVCTWKPLSAIGREHFFFTVRQLLRGEERNVAQGKNQGQDCFAYVKLPPEEHVRCGTLAHSTYRTRLWIDLICELVL
jgi:hypothetical protein